MADQNGSEGVSEATLELLRRRIADEVARDVRTKLLVTYGAVGVALAGLISVIGVNIIERAEDRVARSYEERMRSAESEARTKLDSLTREMKGKVDDIAKHYIDQIGLVSKDAVDRIARDHEKQRENIDGIRSRMNGVIAEIDGTHRTLSALLGEVSDKYHDVAPKVAYLSDHTERMQALESARKELGAAVQRLVGLEETSRRLPEQVASLAADVARLSDVVGRIGSGPVPDGQLPSGGGVGAVASSASAVAAAAGQLTRRIDEVRDRPTVYFQFAGSPRRVAESFSAALKSRNYIIPGEERTAGAANRREVRYFYEGDRSNAEHLAADAAQLLSSHAQTPVEVAVKPVLELKNKNAEGIIELWLELPPQWVN